MVSFNKFSKTCASIQFMVFATSLRTSLNVSLKLYFEFFLLTVLYCVPSYCYIVLSVSWYYVFIYNFILFTGWKTSVFEVFLVRIFPPHLVRMPENTDQKNSEYGHFLCSAWHHFSSWLDVHLPLIDKLERTNKSVLMPMIKVKTPPPPVATPFSKSFLKKNTLAVLPGCCFFLNDVGVYLPWCLSFLFYSLENFYFVMSKLSWWATIASVVQMKNRLIWLQRFTGYCMWIQKQPSQCTKNEVSHEGFIQ